MIRKACGRPVKHKKPNQQLSDLCTPSLNFLIDSYWLSHLRKLWTWKQTLDFSLEESKIFYWMGSITITGKVHYQFDLLAEVSHRVTQMLRRQNAVHTVEFWECLHCELIPNSWSSTSCVCNRNTEVCKHKLECCSAHILRFRNAFHTRNKDYCSHLFLN